MNYSAHRADVVGCFKMLVVTKLHNLLAQKTARERDF